MLVTGAAVFMKKIDVIVVQQSLFFIGRPNKQNAAGFDKQNAALPCLAHHSLSIPLRFYVCQRIR